MEDGSGGWSTANVKIGVGGDGRRWSAGDAANETRNVRPKCANARSSNNEGSTRVNGVNRAYKTRVSSGVTR